MIKLWFDNQAIDLKLLFHYKLLKLAVGLKDLASPTHFISNPKPTLRKRKRPRMNNEGPRLLWGFAEDHPVLGRPRSLKEEAAHLQRRPSLSSQRKGPTQGDSYKGMVEEQF